MKECNKDCLNCPLERCKYDLYEGNVYNTIDGKTKGLYERLALMIKLRGYSQKMLAIETGITQPTISAYVNDLRKPRADHIVVICKTLKCSADWLLGMEQ